MTLRDDASRTTLDGLDYTLIFICTGLAVWCAGESIAQRIIAQQFVGIVGAGTLGAYLIRRLGKGKSWLALDGVLYALVGFATVFASRALNETLPEGGFPREIGAAGILCWLIAFMSPFCWRQPTVLFQTVPAIALFGLCGALDTYPPLPFLFFGFLLALAALLSRSHAREMLRAAKKSGFGGDLPEDSPQLRDQAVRGPWRQLAGPEWALASALAVILLSLLGAPVIQKGVQQVVPPIPGAQIRLPNRPQPSLGSGELNQSSVIRVGAGPNRNLSKRKIAEADLREYRYLRTAYYGAYEGGGWQTLPPPAYELSPPTWLPFVEPTIKDPDSKPFTLRMEASLPSLPVPGEVTVWYGPPVASRPDGLFSQEPRVEGARPRRTYTGRYITAGNGVTARNAVRDLPDALRVTLSAKTTERVRRFALEAAAKGGTDREKAEAIRHAISRQARYNLLAPAIETGGDAVDQFLFVTREGYCDLYATAMTVCARQIGLPARYVQGFAPDRRNRDQAGTYVVLESDYHAWSEIWMDGEGWVVFDATEGTDEVPGQGRGDAVATENFWERPGFQTALNVVIGGMAVFIVGAIGWNAWRKPKTVKLDTRDAERRLQRHLMNALEKTLGRRRWPGETLREMAREAGLDESLVARLNAAADGPNPVSPEELGILKVRVTTAIAELRARPSR